MATMATRGIFVSSGACTSAAEKDTRNCVSISMLQLEAFSFLAFCTALTALQLALKNYLRLFIFFQLFSQSLFDFFEHPLLDSALFF